MYLRYCHQGRCGSGSVGNIGCLSCLVGFISRVPLCLLVTAGFTLLGVALDIQKGDREMIRIRKGICILYCAHHVHILHHINTHTLTPNLTHFLKFLHPLQYLIFIPLGLTTQMATSQLLQTPLFCLGILNSELSHITHLL